jgi:mannose-1-phosphate guanylyltransferase
MDAMKALVLAAGLGERVRPLTETVPKPLLEVGGRRLIDYPLAMLRGGGVREVVINVHHLAGAIQKALGNGRALGLDITYSPEPVLFGTGGPLSVLRGFFGDQTFVIANSDSIVDLDLAAMLAQHRDRGALVTISLHPAESEDAYIDAQSRIRQMRLLRGRDPVRFDDYPRELVGIERASLKRYRYCGVIAMEPAVFELMPKSPPWGLMDQLIAPMVAEELPVFGFVHEGLFRTVDDLKGYEALRREFETSPPQFRHLRF